jgi:DNA-binding NarL/FixJ family response regulator
MTVTVHISEDSIELRTLLRRWLERDERIEVVGEAGNGADAIKGLAALRPDVALLDLSMPRSLGVGMIAAIREVTPDTRVLVITGSQLDSAQRVLGEADAYLLKPAPMPELAAIVCSVAAGGGVALNP